MYIVRTLARLILIVVGTSFGALCYAGQAGAHHCSGESDFFDGGGEASGECHGETPSTDGSHRGMTEREKWDAFCQSSEDWGNGSMPWADGSTSEIFYQSPPTAEDIARLGFDPTGEYGFFKITCRHAGGRSAQGGNFYYTITDPVPVEVLRERAKARIVIADPSIDSNPSFTDRFAVVKIDTWLWADPAYWVAQDESETAGFTTVEVFATPATIDWWFSDGSTTTCNGPGKAWQRGAGDTDCKVEFRRSSAGQPDDAFRASATVSWIFTWSLNGADQGPFDAPFLATTDFEIQVGEIQAVGS